jgi:uncharacterized membrane protein HdeD (DUF308 family)
MNRLEPGEKEGNMSNTADSLEYVRQVGRAWWLVFTFGLLTALLGIVILFKPGGTVHVFAIIVGVWLVVLGVYRFIIVISEPAPEGSSKWAPALFAVLAVLIGLLILHKPFETVSVVGFLIGLFWVGAGLVELFSGFTPEAEGHRAGRIILGLIGTIVGILCLVYPGLSLSILAVVVGIGILLYGIVEMAVSFQIRKLARAT